MRFSVLILSWLLVSVNALQATEPKVLAKDKPCHSACFSPDNKIVVWGGGDFNKTGIATDPSEPWGYLRWMHVGKQEVIREIKLDAIVWCVTFSPDGKLVAVGTNGVDRVLILDADTGKVKQRLGGLYVDSLEFSRDGRHLAARDHGTVTVWETQHWQQVRQLHFNSFTKAVAFFPDGKSVFMEAPEEGVRRIDLQTKQSQVTKLIGLNRAWHFTSAYSADGRTAATGHGKTTTGIHYKTFDDYVDDQYEAGQVAIWDLQTGKGMWFQGHNRHVTILRFSPKGDQVASASDDGNVRVWDVKNGKEVASWFPHRSELRSLAFSPDGKMMVTCGIDYTVRLTAIAGK